MIALDDFEQVKREVQEVQRLVDRSRGRFAENMRGLRKKYGFKTLKDVIRGLKAAKAAEVEAAKKWSAAEKAWRPVFEKVKEAIRDS